MEQKINLTKPWGPPAHSYTGICLSNSKPGTHLLKVGSLYQMPGRQLDHRDDSKIGLFLPQQNLLGFIGVQQVTVARGPNRPCGHFSKFLELRIDFFHIFKIILKFFDILILE